jgi:Transposase DDE domain
MDGHDSPRRPTVLTRIVRNSPHLCAFLEEVPLELSKPQRQHVLNLADSLLVCEDTKTLAALQRQFLDAPDPSNMADFLRISPWSTNVARQGLRQFQVAWLLQQAQQHGLPKVLFVNIDDSLGQKGKATRHIEPVDWFHDHNESTRRQPRYKNAFCYLECTLRIGTLVATVDLRLYLRAKTVRRLNRHRSEEHRLAFRSKNHLARVILTELRPLLPKDWTVYVQVDSWYASEQLIRFVHRQKWHAVCALKCNRTLNGRRLDTVAYALRHKRYTHVCVTAAGGNKATYYVRDTNGRLSDVPFDVRVFFSKRHPQAKASAYFLSTDLTRSAAQALQGYGARWSCEVVNFYLKTRLGLADFRVRSYEAVDRYMVVVHLTWAYVEWRFATEASAQIKCYGDLIRQHRDEHARAWLTEAVRMALATGNEEAVLERFLHPCG